MSALEDLRSVDKADVYKGDRRAATLIRDRGDVVFSYDEDYLADDQAPAVARTFPLTTDPVICPGGAVPAFFAGLLPEGIRLRAVVLGSRTSEDDHLTLLLAVGQDAIGDVRVVPSGERPLSPPVVFDEAKAGESDLAAIFAEATSTHFDMLGRVALPGVQVKVSAQMVSAPVATSRGPAILKLNPPHEYPRLVENEDFFLSMAEGCGLSVPDHRIVHDEQGRAGLLVSRFDRVRESEGAWMALPQEDACQLLGVYPAGKYRLKTEDVAVVLAETVEEGDGSRTLALRRVFEVVAFSYLIGNGDLHGKNFSARQAPAGFWEVTKMYDLVTTQPYLSWRDPMALNLFGKANRLDRKHLLESGERLGLPSRALSSSLDSICQAAQTWIERVGEIGFDTAATERLAEMMTKRLAELRGDGRVGNR